MGVFAKLPDELRERLRSRLEEVQAGNEDAAPVVPPKD